MAAPLLALGLLASLFIACGRATPSPGATVTPSPIPIASPVLRCPDPYPEGAPYDPTPGAPIRVRPQGAPRPLGTFAPLPFTVDPTLEQVVLVSIAGDEGQEHGEEHFAVVVKNLADGQGMALAPERTFYAASVFKTWVMLEVFHQREAGLLDFDELYIVSDYYESFGLRQGEAATCEQVTVDQALGRMLAVSDNMAANLLLDRVGSTNVNATLRRLGLEISSVPADGSLPTNAGDMALLLEAIARGDVVNEAARDEMLELLASESIADRLPSLLPEGTRVAHKTGNWQNATHDAGIVFSPQATYIIVVLTDLGYQDDGATRIAKVSRAVYDYYNEN